MSAAASSGQYTCGSCDRTSTLPHLDARGNCPGCRASIPRPGLFDSAYTILLWLLAFAFGSRGDPIGAFFMAFFGIYPVMLVDTVLHEGAHALVGRLLGWRVYAVAIGAGEVSSRLRFGRAEITFHRRLLRGGHCLAAPEVGNPSPGAIALFTAAPTFLHAILAAVALRWASAESLGGMAAAMFVVSNALLVPANLWPRRVADRGPDVWTDGKTLIDLCRSRDAELARWSLSARYLATQHERKPEEAFDVAERALAREPGNQAAAACFTIAARMTGRWEAALPHVVAYARAMELAFPRELRKLPDRALAARGLFRGSEHEEYMRGSILVSLDRLDEVLALSERGVARATSEETRALWQGCVALSLLMAERDLDRAEEAARYAYERLPWVPFVEAAWGMARIERGDAREGLRAFARAARTNPEATVELRAAWTVVARAVEGRPECAVPAELQAPTVWPACRRRAERALAR
ncbi:MAG TPA: hypothetical protein VFY93_16760 [Planctomycetota bacterium]|nr:hypothetical protein [Planctomycetota bacterium]